MTSGALQGAPAALRRAGACSLVLVSLLSAAGCRWPESRPSEVTGLEGARAARQLAPVAGEIPRSRQPAGVGRMLGYFPNVPLTTHEGVPVRFYDDVLRDRTVLLHFMFTECGGT
jgi:hypothetical protein